MKVEGKTKRLSQSARLAIGEHNQNTWCTSRTTTRHLKNQPPAPRRSKAGTGACLRSLGQGFPHRCSLACTAVARVLRPSEAACAQKWCKATVRAHHGGHHHGWSTARHACTPHLYLRQHVQATICEADRVLQQAVRVSYAVPGRGCVLFWHAG